MPIFAVIIAAMVLDTAPAMAQEVVKTGGFINFGVLFGAFTPWIEAGAQAVVLSIIGWLAYVAKNKFGLDFEKSHQHTLQVWATNQASALIASGAVRFEGVKVHVDNAALASAANSAIVRIPDAMNWFGLTPDKAKDFIYDKIGQVPAASTEAAVAGAVVAVAEAKTP